MRTSFEIFKNGNRYYSLVLKVDTPKVDTFFNISRNSRVPKVDTFLNDDFIGVQNNIEKVNT